MKVTDRIQMSTLILLIICLFMHNACEQKKESPAGPEVYAVFEGGKEEMKGHNDIIFPQYREQNVIVTNSGKLVVVVQGRNKSDWSDRSGQDLICKTSIDNGKSWSKPLLMISEGEKSICPNATVYDKTTNRIITLYSVFQWPFTDPEIRKSWEGLKNREYMIYSDDEGETWSEPHEITQAAKLDSVTQVFGSGEGIQLKHDKYAGRLVVPGGDMLPPNKRVFAWYSDDHGKNWRTSDIVPNTQGRLTPCENAIVELSDGTLLMNERNQGIGHRWKSISQDGGETWSAFEPIVDLPSISCNSGVISVEHNGKEILLYAGPVGPSPDVINALNEYEGQDLSSQERRRNGVVFASYDQGKTWPFRKLLVPDLFAYSSLVLLPDGNIGLFYESRDHLDINLIRFSRDWLFSN
ncbi:MAG: glycoside hydrolase [Cyclobacteriaceae bacterium]|nr:glycoside hydrolase [Cyclobacteriaceae bacterium]